MAGALETYLYNRRVKKAVYWTILSTNTPPDEKLCHFRSRIFSKVSQKKKFISEVISFFSEVRSGQLFPEVRSQDTTCRGIKRKDGRGVFAQLFNF